MKNLTAVLVLMFNLFTASQAFAQNKNSSQSLIPTDAARAASPPTLLLIGVVVAGLVVGLAFAFARKRQSNNS